MAPVAGISPPVHDSGSPLDRSSVKPGVAIRGTSSLAGAVAAVTVFAVVARGGFFDAAKAIFVIGAGLCLFVAVALDEPRTFGFARSPVVVSLALLGCLSMLSAVWTVAAPDAALRAGAVILALAGLTTTGAVAVRRKSDAVPVAVLIAALATGIGIAGLGAAALRVEPWAQQIAGSWRPGGTFEYPPALALLEFAALPALLVSMTTGRGRMSFLGAFGSAIAGSVIAASHSRLLGVFAVVLLAVVVVWPASTVRATRQVAMAAVVVPVVAGVVALLVVGGVVPANETGGDAGRVIAMVASVGLLTVSWTTVRNRVALAEVVHLGAMRRRRGVLGVVSLVVVLGVVAAIAGGGDGDIAHGRTELWGVALDVADDHLAKGVGSEAFLTASADSQPTGQVTRFVHQMPLEFLVELGVLGFIGVLGLYWAVGRAVFRARGSPGLFLLGPGVIGFLIANLVDWPWHLAGVGAVWAVALGGLLACDEALSC